MNDSDEPSPRSDQTPAHPFDVQPLLLLARLSLKDPSIGDSILSFIQETTFAGSRWKEEEDEGATDKGGHRFDNEQELPCWYRALDLDDTVC